MAQAGILAIISEFVGAVALGAKVTDTIKNGIIDIGRFEGRPGVLMLAMGCAEVGSASWLIFATGHGMPVSTTQTIVGALIGVGFATQSSITWKWTSGSVSQVAASWGVAPGIAAAFSAVVFATVKYSVLERQDSFKWAMRLIPLYFAGTAAILALFISIEAPGSDIDALGGGTVAGIILAVFFGILIIAYVFFMPYFERKLIRKDTRLRVWHVPLGPLLRRDDPPLYFPGKGDVYVQNYYEDAYGNVTAGKKDDANSDEITTAAPSTREEAFVDTEKATDKGEIALRAAENTEAMQRRRETYVPPYKRWIKPVEHLSWMNPRKLLNWAKFLFLRGVTIDVVTHDSELLRAIHAKANRYDVRVEHLWTYCQVVSAILMSIAHGSNGEARTV